jgi:hypothetical protein
MRFGTNISCLKKALKTSNPWVKGAEVPTFAAGTLADAGSAGKRSTAHLDVLLAEC